MLDSTHRTRHTSSIIVFHRLLPPKHQILGHYDALLEHFWPKLLTLSFLNAAGNPIVAVRTPLYPVARALITIVVVPLTSPSVNSSGLSSSAKPEHAYDDLNGKVGSFPMEDPAL